MFNVQKNNQSKNRPKVQKIAVNEANALELELDLHYKY